MEIFCVEIRSQFIKDKEIKPTGFWGAFGTHIGGLIGAAVMFMLIVLMIFGGLAHDIQRQLNINLEFYQPHHKLLRKIRD